MIQATNYSGPEWDSDNRRFRPPECCPYPDCAAPVQPLHFLPALGWCATCERPFEAVRDAVGASEVYRRPWSAFSTTDGSPLRGDSLLDWNEAGGSASRSHSPRDPLGHVFGLPRADRRFVLREGWYGSLLPDAESTTEDHVIGINVVRGQVVATTARGWIGLFDASDGRPRLQRPLEWPDRSTDPLDPGRAVLQPPVLRGSRMLVAAPHQAVFRDLAPYLFHRGSGSEHAIRSAGPAPGRQFLGPPLGLDLPPTGADDQRDDTGDGVLFALLEGRADLRRQAFVDTEIRLFRPDGTPVARCPAPGLQRPPAFDAVTGSLLWVDARGVLSILDRARLEALLVASTTGPGELEAPELETTAYTPRAEVDLEPSSLPTLQVVPDPHERAEVWVSRETGGRVELLHATLDDITGGGWQWQRRDLGDLGDLMGFAVGYASRQRQNAGGHLLAVATDRMVAVFPRQSSAASVLQPLRGPQQRFQGSREAPLVCSAGVLARFQDGLRLGSQGLGWNDIGTPSHIRIPGAYETPQGLALLGRDLFLGQGMGVHCCRLQPEDAP